MKGMAQPFYGVLDDAAKVHHCNFVVCRVCRENFWLSKGNMSPWFSTTNYSAMSFQSLHRREVLGREGHGRWNIQTCYSNAGTICAICLRRHVCDAIDVDMLVECGSEDEAQWNHASCSSSGHSRQFYWHFCATGCCIGVQWAFRFIAKTAVGNNTIAFCQASRMEFQGQWWNFGLWECLMNARTKYKFCHDLCGRLNC